MSFGQVTVLCLSSSVLCCLGAEIEQMMRTAEDYRVYTYAYISTILTLEVLGNFGLFELY